MSLRSYALGGIATAIAVLTVTASQPLSYGAQKAAPRLTGEQLASVKGIAGSSANCKAASGSFTFAVSGNAAGPYPGTFTAKGAVTMAKEAPARYSATIHITSKAGKVTITESLTKSADNKGFCLPGYGLTTITAKYHASIVIGGHTTKETGAATGAVTGGAAKTSQLRQFF